MRDRLPDELLSAYLDGELSTALRAQVEAYLAENSAARQLLAELEMLSSAVQSLPKQQMDTQRSTEILMAIEHNRPPESAGTRQRIAGTRSHSETAGNPPPRTRLVPGQTTGQTMRGWVWAALSVAAALLILLFSGEWSGQNREMVDREPMTDARTGMPSVQDLHRGVPNEPSAPGTEGLSQKGYAIKTDAARAPRTDLSSRSSSRVDESVDPPEATLEAVPALKTPDSDPNRNFLYDGDSIWVEHEQPIWFIVDLTHDAARNKAFEAVLEKHAIALQPCGMKTAAGAHFESQEPADSAADPISRMDPLDLISNAPSDPDGWDREEEAFEVVLVEASPTQLQKALAEFNSDINNFRRLAVVGENYETNGLRGRYGRVAGIEQQSKLKAAGRRYKMSESPDETLARDPAELKSPSSAFREEMDLPQTAAKETIAAPAEAMAGRADFDETGSQESAMDPTPAPSQATIQGRAWRFSVSRRANDQFAGMASRAGAAGQNRSPAHPGSEEKYGHDDTKTGPVGTALPSLAAIQDSIRQESLGSSRSIPIRLESGNVWAVFVLRATPPAKPGSKPVTAPSERLAQ